ncbi:MAG TPA: hypothetical protein VJ810_21045 [Blastocatellia bacterium]|nr:hypothetical protein [Blastocatellia bacterium]
MSELVLAKIAVSKEIIIEIESKWASRVAAVTLGSNYGIFPSDCGKIPIA